MRYAKEQIKKTLRLFEETQSVTETIRKLGYPIREYFYTWKKKRAQYETFPDIPRERKKSLIINTPQRPLHPSCQVKLSILKRCFEQGEQVQDVSRETGYSRAIIYSWYRKYRKLGVSGLMNRRKNRSDLLPNAA